VDGASLVRMASAQAEGYSIMKQDLGVAHLGHRTQILDGIERLQAVEAEAARQTSEMPLAWRQARLELPSAHTVREQAAQAQLCLAARRPLTGAAAHGQFLDWDLPTRTKV
jgi:hypothetical protein